MVVMEGRTMLGMTGAPGVHGLPAHCAAVYVVVRVIRYSGASPYPRFWNFPLSPLLMKTPLTDKPQGSGADPASLKSVRNGTELYGAGRLSRSQNRSWFGSSG